MREGHKKTRVGKTRRHSSVVTALCRRALHVTTTAVPRITGISGHSLNRTFCKTLGFAVRETADPPKIPEIAVLPVREGRRPRRPSRFCRNPNRQFSPAFTVIELLVVVVIAFMLLALMSVVWRKIETRNMTTRAQTQLSHLQSALQDYRNEQGCYPDSLADVSNRLPRAFTRFDAAGQPFDPWGTNFVYTVNAGGLTYTLFSSGPDGVDTNTEDNIYPGRF